jgi:hypothetical protein
VDGILTGWVSCFDAKRCLLWRTRFVISIGWWNGDEDEDGGSKIGVEDRWDKTITVSADAGGGGKTTVSIYFREINME